MDTQQLIAKFNPANGSKLTAEDLATLRDLTDAQIDELAKAYPNVPSRKSYLRLYNKSLAPNKQLYPLSTWQNLRNARKYSNMKNLVAFDFITTGASVAKADPVKSRPKMTTTQPTKKVVVDMSAKEAAAELTQKVGNKAEKVADNTAGNDQAKTSTTANVEKKPVTTAPLTAEKPAKAKPAAKTTAKKSEPKAEAPVVEKSTTPADEQFPPIN